MASAASSLGIELKALAATVTTGGLIQLVVDVKPELLQGAVSIEFSEGSQVLGRVEVAPFTLSFAAGTQVVTRRFTARMTDGVQEYMSNSLDVLVVLPSSRKLPVFLAQGHLGRTTFSCDGGQSWIANRSKDDSARCWGTNNQPDCDHNPFAGRGLAYGDGWFVATWGWGAPGTVERTRDGVHWEPVMTNTSTFSDIAFGNGLFVANNGNSRFSDNSGMTWQAGGNLNLDTNDRGIHFVNYDGGRFISVGDGAGIRAISWSRDSKTWTPARTRPDACGDFYKGMASNEKILVLASGRGSICYSENGGMDWSHVSVTQEFTSNPIWTGSQFMVYQGENLYRSVDGKSWTRQSLSPASVRIGAQAIDDKGVQVASIGGWKVWYENQAFYRSTDGVNWTVLDSSKFQGSHPINFIEFGYVDAGGVCGP